MFGFPYGVISQGFDGTERITRSVKLEETVYGFDTEYLALWCYMFDSGVILFVMQRFDGHPSNPRYQQL